VGLYCGPAGIAGQADDASRPAHEKNRLETAITLTKWGQAIIFPSNDEVALFFYMRGIT
jgi:hypothetical protein